MKILFICKHNRFRSRVASAYFNKINKNTGNISKGAGIFGDHSNLDENEVGLSKERGVDIRGKPQQVNSELLEWADKIIIVADDVSKQDIKVKDKEVIIWKVHDVDDASDAKKAIKETIQEIKKRVDELSKLY